MYHKSGFSALVLLMVIVLLQACGKTDRITVKPANFGEQADPYQELEFDFSHDLASDTIFNRWDTARYLIFEPAVQGRYRWLSASRLSFVPSAPLSPNTEYKVRISAALISLSGKALKPADEILGFHTPFLSLERTHAYWGLHPEDPQQIQLRVNLVFNYPVDPAKIRSFITLKSGVQTLAYDILTPAATEEMELAVTLLPEALSGNDLEVTAAKGLQCVGSDRPLPEALVLALSIPPRDRLEIAEARGTYEEGTGVITVYTSQPVRHESLKACIQLNPSLPFEVSAAGSGFRIQGDFSEGTVYTLSVSGNLRGVFGPELGNDFTQQVTFGTLKPYLAFTEQNSFYLTPHGARNLGVQIISIPRIKVTVFRVFENNIQHYLRSGKEWNWHYQDDSYYESYTYPMDENSGMVVSTREYETKSLPRKGNFRLLNLSPSDLEVNSARKGIYLIRAASAEKPWLGDTQLISVSDIGLIVRQGADEIFVAARSFATALPMSGVELRFISRNNQEVQTLTTGSDGTAVLRNVKQLAEGFTLSMISARKEDDFNVLLFDRSEVETSRFDVAGKRTAGMNYDVFMYGDRTLYRPGDSVYVNAIVRTHAWETVDALPVKFRVIAPDGKDFLLRRDLLGNNGSAQLDFKLPVSTLTGGYTIELLASNDVLMGSYRVRAEDFMPDRIRVDVSKKKRVFRSGELLEASVTATNLFGPPAAGRKVENELRISRYSFRPQQYVDYNFGITTKSEPVLGSQVAEGITDADGKFVQRFELPGITGAGILEGGLYTTVFDETGRPVNRYASIQILTQDYMLGIRELPGWVGIQKPLDISLIALGPDEKTVNGRARVEVVRIDWETVLERNYGQTAYRSQRREKVVFSREINVPAAGAVISYSPPSAGEYQVRVSLPGNPAWVTSTFYAWSTGNPGSPGFYVNRDGEVGIETDRAGYQPGDVAAILFKAPFDGELLVTVEQDKVLEHHSLKVVNGGAALRLKIGGQHMPNAYIGATLIRRTDGSGMPLTVAHGYKSIEVTQPSRKLYVSVQAPEKSRSGVRQTIKVKTRPHAGVTIAVVDEGILQVNAQPSPDPFAHFYGKRALEVTPYDLFDELYPELLQGSSSTGGDRAFDLMRRLNPLTAKRVELLSRWSGVRKANASGEATFEVSIPAFSGSVRIMAVAWKDNQFGAASRNLTVADPLVISTSLPRFLSPGDEATVVVSLSNTTGKSIKVKPSVSVTGPVEAGSFESHSMEIPAGAEVQATFPLRAKKETGIAQITVNMAGQSETFRDKTEIGVRPASGLVKHAEAVTIADGGKRTFKAPVGIIQGTVQSKLLLTQNPAGHFARELSELVNYPHGCLEQTISAAFPQLYYAGLSALLMQDGKAGRQVVNDNISQAILKIASLQQYNGGLVSWPSGGEIDWWSTAYAGHFLTEASQAGYSTNPQVLKNILGYLTEKVKQRPETTSYYTSGNGGPWLKRIQPAREIFYSLYVLALNGEQQMPVMNYYKARLQDLSYDSRYLLACTYALAGDIRNFNQLLPASWDQREEPFAMSGGSYSSPVRDRAISLYTLVSIDANHLQVPLLARQLGEMLSGTSWLSTQERAFSLLALGKLAVAGKPGNLTATVSVSDGKTSRFSGEDLIITTDGKDASVATSGSGNLYAYYEVSGIPASGPPTDTDRVLQVRRRLLSRDGDPVNPARISQHDLLVVEISLRTTDNTSIENVVVTDLLPACFEVENTRLTEDRRPAWIEEYTTPDYIDVRDDRVNLFTLAGGSFSRFYYLVRVTGRGTFVHGPVNAEAMYNGQYYSTNGASTITVR